MLSGSVDWTLVARYAGPVLGVMVGFLINRAFERRPNLISYIAHASAVQVRPPNGTPDGVHSHAVVVRNGGKKPAENVRLGHAFLPDFSVYPDVPYSVQQLPGGGSEVVFPKLVPGEQVTLTYLYFPPLTVAGVNTYTKSDEGFARIVTMLPTQQFPNWFNRTVVTLTLIGAITVVVIVVEIVIRLIAWLAAA